jgi:hypothetical protein
MNIDVYFQRYTSAFASGYWGDCLDSFHDDAILEFHGINLAPLIGKQAISSACLGNPPYALVEAVDVECHGTKDVTVTFRSRIPVMNGSARFTLKNELSGGWRSF